MISKKDKMRLGYNDEKLQSSQAQMLEKIADDIRKTYTLPFVHGQKVLVMEDGLCRTMIRALS